MGFNSARQVRGKGREEGRLYKRVGGRIGDGWRKGEGKGAEEVKGEMGRRDRSVYIPCYKYDEWETYPSMWKTTFEPWQNPKRALKVHCAILLQVVSKFFGNAAPTSATL